MRFIWHRNSALADWWSVLLEGGHGQAGLLELLGVLARIARRRRHEAHALRHDEVDDPRVADEELRDVDPERLVGEIALLDTRYQGREAETTPEQWARYLERRGRLKAELEAALARESGGR